MNILDQGQGEELVIRDIADDRTDLAQTCTLRGAPSTLPGNDLVSTSWNPANQQRLNKAIGSNRLREFLELRLVKMRPWLFRIRLDQVNIEIEQIISISNLTLGH